MVSKFLPDSMKFGGMVSKATSDDEVPTAGYLQEELKRLTWDPDACNHIEDSMLSRLEKKSCNVRLKTLRLMKLLVETGSPNFKRDLQRRTQAVRDCLHFRGDPHPTMGDLPSKLVRDTAQEVVNAIFDTSNDHNRQPPPPPAQPAPAAPAPASASSYSAPAPSSGVSSGVPASAPKPSAPEPKKYTGFGSESFGGMQGSEHRSINAYFSNQAAAGAVGSQQDESSVNQMMNKASSAFSAGISQLTGNKPAVTGTSPPRHDPQQHAAPAWQAPPDIPGGGMAGQGDNMTVGMSTPETPAPPPPVPVSHEPVRSAAGQYEETLVQSITAPGGVRAAPPKEDLKALCAKAKSLDMPLLIMLLCSKLEDDAWQSRLKTLHVLDALLKAPDEEVVKNVRKLMRGRLQLLQGLTCDEQRSLADLAGKVAKEVEKAEAPPPRQPAAPAAAAPKDDLLGLGFAGGGAAAPAQGGGATQATGLFAGLSIAGDPTVPPPAAQPRVPEPQGLDQLLNMGGPSGGMMQHQAPPPPPQQDLLGGLMGMSAPAAPQQPQGGMDLLGGMGGGMGLQGGGGMGMMGGMGGAPQQHQDLLGLAAPQQPPPNPSGGGLLDLEKDFFGAAPPQAQQVSSPSAFGYIDQTPAQPSAGMGLGLGGGGHMLNPNSSRPRLGPSVEQRQQEQDKFGFVNGMLKH